MTTAELSPFQTFTSSVERFLSRYFWVLPCAGFGLGWASFLLVQRGEGLARGIALLALLGWLWILAEPFIMNRLLAREHPKLSRNISNFFSQSIQQEIYFFSLPFLFAATQPEDFGQMLFTGIFVLAALVSTVDPWYNRYISTHRIVALAFHALCCFVSALVILPVVVKLPTGRTLVFALGFLVVWLLLVIPGLLFRLDTWKHRLLALVGLCAIPLLIWTFRASIPAAGLSANNATISSGVVDHEPIDSISRIDAAQLSQGVYAFVAVKAPWGLEQEIGFKWQHGDYSETITAVINGGREDGYRTYSMKSNFPEPAGGNWTVDVLTAQGQLLRRLEFVVSGQETVSPLEADTVISQEPTLEPQTAPELPSEVELIEEPEQEVKLDPSSAAQ